MHKDCVSEVRLSGNSVAMGGVQSRCVIKMCVERRRASVGYTMSNSPEIAMVTAMDYKTREMAKVRAKRRQIDMNYAAFVGITNGGKADKRNETEDL